MRSDSDDSSPIVTTRYCHTAAELIHSIEKNIIRVISVIVPLVAFAIMDTLGLLGYLLPGEMDSIVDAIFSVIAVGALLALFRLLLKSSKILNRWADLFERNSITTGMSISMSGRSKEEAIIAISESVEQIGEPLQKYIAARSDLNEFLNVTVDKGLIFDVLLDAKRVSNGNGLKRVLEEYGAVIVKVVDGTVDRNTVISFTSTLLEYVSLPRNQVGLALIIGEEIQQDAYDYARKWSGRRINQLLLVEKPTIQQ